MKYYLFLSLACLFSSCQAQENSQHSLSKEEITRIESFIDKAMQKTDVVPGLGVAIVKGDQIVYSNGFGYRDVENKLPVTAETGFYLASKTKSLTGMAAACLENKGILDLNLSLASFYPGWEFSAPIDAGRISLINLLSHDHNLDNSGLQYRLAFIDKMSSEEFARVLFDLSSERESGFAYSNLSYNIIGDIVTQKTRKPWQNVVEEEVIKPLDLQHTTAYMSIATQREFAFPYIKEGNTFTRLAIKDDGQMQSAGGYVSTPIDLAKWLIVNMNEGQLDGKQVIPKEVMERVHQPYATLEKSYYKFDRQAYEIGWYRSDYEGDQLTHHFGSFDGYMAHVSFMPAHQMGVVVLSNELEYGGRLPHLVATYIYDILLGKENLDTKYKQTLKEWEAAVNESIERTAPRLAQKREMLAKAATNPNNWEFRAEDFVGTFYNPRLGHFDIIKKSDGTLWSNFGVHSAPLLPYDKNQFLIDWQSTGYVSPPVRLEVGYDEYMKVVSLNWGGREFRLLSEGTDPERLNEVHTKIRNALKAAVSLADEEKAKAARSILATQYPSGALTEPYINILGYNYLQRKEFEIAIALFRFNTDYYPDSANAYDSLGEALLQYGDKPNAKLHYQKALKLDPNNERIKVVLEKL